MSDAARACEHDIAERETLVADGYCPKCLLDTLNEVTERAAALRAALQEMVEYETGLAESNYREWLPHDSKWVFTDYIWERADLDGFRRVERARALLAE